MEVVRSVLAGQKDHFRELVQRYSGLCVHFFANRWGFPAETARDLTQETFLRAFRSLSGLAPDSSFKAWLMTIARNLAIDERRRAAGAQVIPGEDILPQIPSGANPADLTRLILREALDKLPPRQRDIVEYRYLLDLTSAEIGKILNLPEGTVRSDLYYARLRLVELLESRSDLT